MHRAAVLAFLVALATLAPARGGTFEPATELEAALFIACREGTLTPDAMAAKLPGAASGAEQPLGLENGVAGWRRRFALTDGGAILLKRAEAPGSPPEISGEYDEPAGGTLRPMLWAAATPACAIDSGRRLDYDESGRAVAVEPLDGTLQVDGPGERLKAALPLRHDPGGVTVAQIDTGVNYLLPQIARRLARDAGGHMLGYDYWTLDDEPFDSHPARSPFFPERHGTATASVLLREAPMARLIPYRYPRPAMERMAQLIDDAAAKGARVITISLGSDHRAEWEGFADGLARHPEMLAIVSAGNDGRDLDKAPVYPAALGLANMISVTSADAATGRPAEGANWGARSVLLAVPGQDIPVIDFAGQAQRFSGSSFAAPRVAALAVRLLAAHPAWRAAELKAAILARVVPVAGARPVAVGAILDPSRP
jgi:subtilisin family serine protease